MNNPNQTTPESMVSEPAPDWRLVWFQKAFAIMGLLLFAGTWKLWTPQTEYPQIPFFEFLVDAPGYVDWIGLLAIGSSLALIFFASASKSLRIAYLSFAAALVVLILLNQHRLQPWAYQFVIFAIIAALAKPKTAFFWMRWIVISIYIYSAISKFDYQFVHTVGEGLLNNLAKLFLMDSRQWPVVISQSLILAMPTIELLIGIGLAYKPSRRIAARAAIAFHCVLILALIGNVDGPGVLIWNVFFVVLVFLLFLGRAREEVKSAGITKIKSGKLFEQLAAVLAIFVLFFPLTRPLGFCDHWLAWEVYAPRTSRAEIKHETSYAIDGRAINQFSGSERILGVPTYPQARFQLAVCMAVLKKKEWDRSIFFSDVSDRHSGERKIEILTGRDQMEMKASRFFLNTKPRPFYFESTDDK